MGTCLSRNKSTQNPVVASDTQPPPAAPGEAIPSQTPAAASESISPQSPPEVPAKASGPDSATGDESNHVIAPKPTTADL